MSLRIVAGLACATAALLAPAAHASTAPICAIAYGSAVPAGARGWHCVGGSASGPCIGASVPDPRTHVTVVGVEVCGLA